MLSASLCTVWVEGWLKVLQGGKQARADLEIWIGRHSECMLAGAHGGQG